MSVLRSLHPKAAWLRPPASDDLGRGARYRAADLHRGLRLVAAAVVCLCGLSLVAPRAEAQTVVSGPFQGTIAAGGTTQLINGASIVGNITNDGTLEFSLTDPLTNTFSISGTGNVLLSNTGTVTFSSGNSYSNGTTIKFGELVIAGGGSVSHAAADMTVGDLSGDNGFLTISGGSVTTYNSTLGYNAGSTGTAVISAGSWTISPSPGSPLPAGDLNVGYAGTGSLTMSGGTIDVAGSSHVGRSSGGGGTFTMSSGTVNVAADFQVGDGGTGSFSMTGGLVNSQAGYIGNTATGNGTVTIASGTWDMTGSLKVGFNGGTGSLAINSGGTVIVGDELSRDLTLGTISLNAGGTLSIGDGGTAGSLLTSLTNNGTLVFDRSDAYEYDSSYSLSGTGDVVKQGAGTLTLNQTNSYSGGTTILGGTIALGPAGVINHGSAAMVIGSSTGDGGGLAVYGGAVTASTVDLYNGTLLVTDDTGLFGTLTSGSATIGDGSSNIATATITKGTWDVSNGMTIGVNGGTGQMDIGDQGVVTTGNSISRNSSTILGVASGDSGTVTVSGNGVDPGGIWNVYGDLTVGGGGTGQLTISTGGSVLVTGTLSQGALGTITVNTDGTLRIGDGGTDGTLAATTLTNNGSIIFDRTTNTTTAAEISGNGSLQKLNTNILTLTGSSSYTGETKLDAGGLFVNGRIDSTVLNAQAGTLLGGSGTIAGLVNIYSGTLSPGSAPGAIGALTVLDLNMNASGDTATEKMTTALSITGLAAGSEYDQIVAVDPLGSTINYDGILDLSISGTDFFPNFSQFDLFSGFSARSGDFSSIVLHAAGTSYDGLVFTKDLTTGNWSTPQNFDALGYGQYLVFAPFDTTLDLGNDVGVPISGGTLVVVPEPGTLALAATGLVALFGAARWRRKQRASGSTGRPTDRGPG